MRTILISAMVMLISTIAYPQKPKINAAILALENGKLDAAKKAIDAAVAHPKTMEDPKAWLYHSIIYSTMYSAGESMLTLMGVSDPDPEVPLKSLNKSVELGAEDKYNDELMQAYSGLVTLYGQQGLKAFQDDKEFEKAVDLMKKRIVYSQKSNPEGFDTLAYRVIAYSSQNNQDFDTAAQSYKALIAHDFHEENAYKFLAQYYLMNNKEDEFIKHIALAKERYPEDQSFYLTEIDYYVQTGRGDDKIEEIEAAAANNPDNTALNLIIGNYYERQENLDEALIWYEKALALDPENVHANFGVATVFFNKGVPIQDEINFLPAGQELKEASLATKRDEWWNKALPYLKKVISLNSDHREANRAMFQYYKVRGDEANAKMYEAKLDTPQ